MGKLSDLISKKIFSFAQGRKIGYVLNVKFDNAFNIDKIIVASEEDEKELELSADRIRISGDNIFIENENLCFFECLMICFFVCKKQKNSQNKQK